MTVAGPSRNIGTGSLTRWSAPCCPTEALAFRFTLNQRLEVVSSFRAKDDKLDELADQAETTRPARLDLEVKPGPVRSSPAELPRGLVSLGITHGVEDAHVGDGDLEVEFGVLLDVRGLGRLGQHDGALLQ